MAEMNFGGVIENVMTREEFPLEWCTGSWSGMQLA